MAVSSDARPQMSVVDTRPARLPTLARYVLFVVVLWAGPLLGAVLLGTSGAPSVERRAVTSPPAGVVTVGGRQVDLASEIAVRITLSPVHETVSPVTGFVTGVFVSRGDRLRDGTPVVGIDGVTRIAERGGIPLYRDLRVGDSGDDVGRLRQLLRNAGYLKERDARSSVFDRALENGVAAFQRRLGVRSNAAVFQAANVIYAPAEFGVVASLEATLGRQIAVGDVLVTDQARVEHLDASTMPGADTTLMSAAGPFRLSRAGASVVIDSLSHPTVRDLRTVETLVTTTSDTVPTKSQSGATTTLTLDAVHAALVHPRQFGTVPVSAIATDAQGKSCVFVLPTGRGSTAVPAVIDSVTPDSGTVGVALVDPSLIGRAILVYAPASERATCT